MYGGNRPPHRLPGGGRGAARPFAPPPPPHLLPQNFDPYYPYPNPYLQNPNFYHQNHGFSPSPTPHFHNPIHHHQQPPTTGFQPTTISAKPSEGQPRSVSSRPSEGQPRGLPSEPSEAEGVSSKPKESLKKINLAVKKAHCDLLAAKESVSVWKVCESVRLSLQVDSWSSLGFKIEEIPALNDLIVIEGKVNAFIHCFVGVRRITSIHDLDVAICKNEGIGSFEDLLIGPLLRHPLVVHYFSVPSGSTEIVRITSEEIFLYLAEFMDTHEDKDIQVHGFLDFLAMKRSVTTRIKLGVRIHSLRMHIDFIREARKAEDDSLKKYIQVLRPTPGKQTRKLEGDLSQKSHIHSQKKVLDRRFNVISQRIKSFSSVNEDFGGKHIKFVSSSSEDESGDDISSGDDKRDENDLSSQCKISSQNRKSYDRVTSCPYPSATEEITRLGLKVEMDDHSLPADESKRSSGKKRKCVNQGANVCLPQKLPKTGKVELNKVGRDLLLPENYKKNDHVNLEKVGDLLLTDDTVEMFITTWKEACQELSVSQVFDKMLDFYNPTAEQRKLMKSMISSYPCIGLLNVAIQRIKSNGLKKKKRAKQSLLGRKKNMEGKKKYMQVSPDISLLSSPDARSIKSGLGDSLYDTIQTIAQQGISYPSNDFESIDVEPSEKDAVSVDQHVSELGVGVNAEDIIKKVATFFDLDHAMPREGKTPLEKLILCLRRLHCCETWLTEHFSVKEFDSLGYGEFLIFLENHVSLLPNELYKSLTGGLSKESSLKVSMLQHQLIVLLSQAARSFSENDIITKQHISVLLKKQFPLINFEIAGNVTSDDLFEIMSKQKRDATFSCVVFSMMVSGKCCIGDSLVPNEKHLLETAGVMPDLGHRVGVLGSVTAKDAVECLLKAPMLSDLQSWSHWDFVFAPSLGPLVEWLLNEGDIKDLLCLVTRDGKIIRIDHSSTVGEFLEALLQGSSFQTAVKLVSLFALYGGERHIPVSLLKCHAQRAIEVMVKNYIDSIEVKNIGDFDMPGKALKGQQILGEDSTSNNPVLVNPAGANVHVMENNELFENLCSINKAVPVVSRFILDCLSSLPSEFCSFAADVFLTGLRFVTKDAALAILRECNHMDQRLMLHDVGLSLGIVEWIEDYHAFCSTAATDLVMSYGTSSNKAVSLAIGVHLKHTPDASEKDPSDGKLMVTFGADGHNEPFSEIHDEKNLNKVRSEQFSNSCMRLPSIFCGDQDANLIIESIRREEFGLDPSLTHTESSILKKQHARLGRALHCLSQELYSQDSHFLLELVQNADDNIYPENVEPTLVFILQDTGIVVLNNEQGFSAQNIKALCDVGNSTKKGSSAGYIGQKGIGFKSVFRVTDAPEIHSNGFHVKFDISEGQIGFVLPTVVSPCDIVTFRRLLTGETDTTCWTTCIVLPFRSKLLEGTGMSSIMSMFSDLHPSLLLFLHRLQCIKFKNMLDDSFIVMRREIMGDGIVRVSHGKEKMFWFVETQKLQASVIRPDVQTTEIALAFTLQESDIGEYKPRLDQQPVFAFLPLRTYGLKFILQGDFVLPSSREEVDGDSAWNQWLLSEFPDLFVSAERSFCALPCFRQSLGKAVTAYMSFVPLDGEVHGFFSHLPRMIISKLRMSNCLLLEGDGKEWVPPCKVLRCWNDQARVILPENLLQQRLGLGYLDKDIILSDPLAKALGIEEYGPKVLIDIISSICHSDNGIDSLGMEWLSSWLNGLYTMLFHSSGQTSLNAIIESDLVRSLRKIPFIPLSDGTYSLVAEGTIWLPFDACSSESEGEYRSEAFQRLYAELRTVRPALFSAAVVNAYSLEETQVDNIVRMLQRIGVQRLSAHEIIKVHILPAISDDSIMNRDKNLMTEYLSFVMLHVQSSCPSCCIEREHIMSELQNRALILTNHGYKRPINASIHFSREFGNPIDVNKLFDATESKWHEVDIIYLQHPSAKSLSSELTRWREFFHELGVTDFVQVVQVVKNVADVSHTVLMNMMQDMDLISLVSIVKDWESPELVHLLSTLSSNNNLEMSKYLLEVLDNLWDDCFSAKVLGHCIFKSIEDSKPFKSSFINCICDVQWVASSVDEKLHYPKDLFYDCEAVRFILGACAPYTVPKVKSGKFLSDIGFKTQVTVDDALAVLQVWRRSDTPFRASIAQMSRFYSFIWDEIATSKTKIAREFGSGPSIFVPLAYACRQDDAVPGMFLSSEEVYWHDSTGSVDQAKELLQHGSISKTISHVYPGLHDFFVHECGVRENPSFRGYLQILLQLSTIALPSQSANIVFRILLKWADDLKSGLVGSEDVVYLKESLLKLEYTVIPTIQDKWVSLHPKFGLVCWCDDDELSEQFKYTDNIDFVYFGELSNYEKEMLPAKLAPLMQTIGIPALSEVITHEAIFYGTEDCREKASLVDWVLPYAQRYIYKLHPDKYSKLKQFKFENLCHLQIIVVQKLFYRHALKRCDSVSKKQVQCSSLLQGNILYTTRASDSHSIFMELGRLFFDGTPQLHFANFLHMITTMAESGSTEEQMEFFILNSQKVPKLPEEEPVWFLSSKLSSQGDDETPLPMSASTMVGEQNRSKSRRKPDIKSNWPPADWKTAPDFALARANHFRTRPTTAPPVSIGSQEDKPQGIISYTKDHGVPIGFGVDWIIQDNLSVTPTMSLLQDSRVMADQHLLAKSSGSVLKGTDFTLEMLNKPFDSVTVPNAPDGCLSTFSERDQLSFGTPNENQTAITGRLGEFVAFKYFAEKVGKSGVKWVNEDIETGLPYDIITGMNEESTEYIEVKATRSENKDWFMISTREWQFAVERGESFSIAHVVLVGPNNARITVFKNPARLCQQGVLQLAVLMSKQHKSSRIM